MKTTISIETTYMKVLINKLYFTDNCTIVHIARVMGITVETVDSLLIHEQNEREIFLNENSMNEHYTLSLI
jgi:hypothetical protein